MSFTMEAVTITSNPVKRIKNKKVIGGLREICFGWNGRGKTAFSVQRKKREGSNVQQ